MPCYHLWLPCHDHRYLWQACICSSFLVWYRDHSSQQGMKKISKNFKWSLSSLSKIGFLEIQHLLLMTHVPHENGMNYEFHISQTQRMLLALLSPTSILAYLTNHPPIIVCCERHPGSWSTQGPSIVIVGYQHCVLYTQILTEWLINVSSMVEKCSECTLTANLHLMIFPWYANSGWLGWFCE